MHNKIICLEIYYICGRGGLYTDPNSRRKGEDSLHETAYLITITCSNDLIRTVTTEIEEMEILGDGAL
jgi:hypothetical protein